MVVRLPEKNYDLTGSADYLPKNPPRVGSVTYSGYERMEWEDVEVEHYEGTLPDDISELFNDLRGQDHNKRYWHGFTLSLDLSVAQTLLQYSNRHETLSEIVAIYSPGLAAITGVTEIDPSSIDWLGYDIGGWGLWSLLRGGYFARPSLFSEWEAFINSHGLFASTSKVEDYIRAYDLLGAQNLVEPRLDVPVEVFEIGRVTA